MAPFAARVKNKDLVPIFLKCDIARPDPEFSQPFLGRTGILK
jgi:hypothetical protein